MGVPPPEIVDIDPAREAAWFETVSCLHLNRRNVRTINREDDLPDMPPHLVAAMRRVLPSDIVAWECDTCGRTVESRDSDNSDPFVQRGTLRYNTPPLRLRRSPKACREVIEDLAADWGWR